MTRTGTRRGHRFYRYYSCAGCHQKGKSVCAGRHVPMDRLDDIVVSSIKEKLFHPERLRLIPSALLDRQSAKNDEVQARRALLEAELRNVNDKLARLYRAIEEGIVDLDADLKVRVEALKAERAIVEVPLDRVSVQIERV